MKKISYLFLAMASMMLSSCSGEFWQGMAEGGLALLSAAAYMPSSSSMGSGSMDYLLDPSYAIAQTKQNMHNEWYQATGGGKTMSYDQYWATKAQIEMSANTSQTKSSSSTSNSSSRKSSSSSSSRHTCPLCKGSGRISHDSYPATYGTQDYKVYCNECKRNYMKSTGHSHVTCSQCHGKGYF